jgi:hypothetical protein
MRMKGLETWGTLWNDDPRPESLGKNSVALHLGVSDKE